jgi:cell division protein FtsL
VLVVRRPLVRAAGDGRHVPRIVRSQRIRRIVAPGLLLVAACVIHVWLGLQVTRVGYELSAARQVELRLTHQKRELEIELATLRNLTRIGDLARQRLGMTTPHSGQVIVLP